MEDTSNDINNNTKQTKEATLKRNSIKVIMYDCLCCSGGHEVTQYCLGEPTLNRVVEAVLRPADMCRCSDISVASLKRMVIDNYPAANCSITEVTVDNCVDKGNSFELLLCSYIGYIFQAKKNECKKGKKKA